MANKHVYEGNFENNQPSGKGKLTVGPNKYYEGQVSYANGKFTIKGKLFFDGAERKGTFSGEDATTEDTSDYVIPAEEVFDEVIPAED